VQGDFEHAVLVFTPNDSPTTWTGTRISNFSSAFTSWRSRCRKLSVSASRCTSCRKDHGVLVLVGAGELDELGATGDDLEGAESTSRSAATESRREESCSEHS